MTEMNGTASTAATIKSDAAPASLLTMLESDEATDKKEPTSAAVASGSDDAPASLATDSSDKVYYDFFLPNTPEGLMCRIGTSDYKGYYAKFLNYRRHANGRKSFAETNKLFRNIGDVVIAVDGLEVKGVTFEGVIGIFAERSKLKKVIQIRMLDTCAVAAKTKAPAAAPSKSMHSSDSIMKHHDKNDNTQSPSPSEVADFVLNCEDEIFLQGAISAEISTELQEIQQKEMPTTLKKGKVASQLPSMSSRDTNEYYDVCLPKTQDGFMYLLHSVEDHRLDGYTTAFFGYHRHHDGRLSQAETKRVFRNIGDVIVSVDGLNMKWKTFAEVCNLSKRAHNEINIRLIDIQKSSNSWKSAGTSSVAEESKPRGRSNGGSGIVAKELNKIFTSPRASMESNGMVEDIPAPEPELAALGWTRKAFRRSATPLHIDRYWYTPETQKKLRSRVEVSKFLAYLEDTGGDEDEAFILFKKKAKHKAISRDVDEKLSTIHHKVTTKTTKDL